MRAPQPPTDEQLAARVATVRAKVRARYEAALAPPDADVPANRDDPPPDLEELARRLEISTWNQTIARAEADGVPRFWSCARFRDRYTQRALSLAFNVRRAPGVRERLLSGELGAKRFVAMTPYELCPQLWEPIFERLASRQLRRMAPVPATHDSPYACGRCKSRKVCMTQLQTRSADEPMTCFFFCQECGKNWKS